MSATLYIDSQTGTVHTNDPNTAPARPVVDVGVPEGTTLRQLMGALNGWASEVEKEHRARMQMPDAIPPGSILRVVIG